MKPVLPRLLRLALPHWRRLLLAVVLGSATVASNVGLMAASAFIIASAALHPSIAQLQVAIVGVRFFGIARGLFRYAERLVSHDLTFRLLARLRVWFYSAVEPLAPARLTRRRSGDLLARVVSDVETLEDLFARALAPPLVALVIAAGAVGFLARYHPALAIAHLLFLALGGLATPLLTRRLTRGLGRRERELAAELHQLTVDVVQGMGDLLAAGRQGRVLERASAAGSALARSQLRMGRVAALDTAVGGLAAQLGLWCLLLLAVPMVRAARFDGVGLAVLTLAALASFEAVQSLPAALQQLEGQLAAARRLFEIVDAEPEVVDPAEPVAIPVVGKRETKDAPPPAPRVSRLETAGVEGGQERLPLPISRFPSSPVLRVEALRFAYPDAAAPALDGIDLELREGERLALVGPSGAGKSTLAALTLRFWEGWEGVLELWGQDIRRYAQDDVRRSLGVVAQTTHLFAGSVRTNLLLARPGASESELWSALEQARLAPFVRALSDRLDSWVGEQGVQLSGGQRQRLAVARTLLRDPALLLLDEPTANLDTVTEGDLLRTLYALGEGRATLMITHRLVRMERFDRIVVLDRGRIVEAGTHTELSSAGGLYARLWALQHDEILLSGSSELPTRGPATPR